MTNLAFVEGDAASFMGLMGTQAISRYDLSNQSYIGTWDAMYTGPLKDVDGLIEVSQSNPHYLGIAQVLKAIGYSSMVDMFGDIPYTEALKGDAGTKVLNPTFDDDAAIYASCLTLVDDAIANFGKPSASVVTGDLIYAGSIAKWTAAAKSFKLKLLMTARKAIPDADAKIAALVKAGGLIATAGEDFTFVYSKDPTSIRHPYYTGAYTGEEFDYTYMCHEFMVESLIEDDPRWPFQFRRQSEKILNLDDATDRNTAPCAGNGSCVYGYVVKNPVMIERIYTAKGKTFGAAEEKFLAGIFGRDRGDADGIPADGALRTIPGVYPCGGYYDIAKVGIPAANAATGGGIFPFLTGVNVNYYVIEAILASGAEGDARAEFKKAIEGHISRVVNFSVGADVNCVRPTNDAIAAYVNTWLAKFDAAPSNEAKLDIALKQLWFSSLGNGFESYNAYRRTGLPTKIQEHIDGTLRGFPLRLPYPQNELTLNPNAEKYKAVAFDKEPVFWDK
jgi:hypothetical protein